MYMAVARKTKEPRTPTMPGRITPAFHRSGRCCLHQARSVVRSSASRTKNKLDPLKYYLGVWQGGGGGRAAATLPSAMIILRMSLQDHRRLGGRGLHKVQGTCKYYHVSRVLGLNRSSQSRNPVTLFVQTRW